MLDLKYPGEESRPVFSIEIEGPAVSIESNRRNLLKFKSLKAPINLILLFQVDNDRTIKKRPPKKYGLEPKEYVDKLVKEAEISVDVEIMLDEDLMLPNGIEKLQQKAEKALKEMESSK